MRGVVELGLALMLTGCTATTSIDAPSLVTIPSAAPTHSVAPAPHPSRSRPFVGPTVKPTKPAPAGGIMLTTNGPGWDAAGLGGPTFPAGSCHYRYLADGQALADPHCTPGAVDSSVNDGTLSNTICRTGYTRTVRPPYSLTGPAKRESMIEYGATGPTSAYEYDHLIPLELGGSSSTWNLWAQPNLGGSGDYYSNPKDQVENALKYAVCDGRASLRAAQLAIATNWETAEAVLGL